MSLFSELLFKGKRDEFSKRVEDELEKMLAEGTDSDEEMETIVDDYYALLKFVCSDKKPSEVTIDRENPFALSADGTIFDFDELIHHNDSENTERKMEIESLLSEVVSEEEIETRLNQRIQEEW